MGCQLRQALRSLCFDVGWDYAVFWKLKHQDLMMLTWEDAYYHNHEQCDPSENTWFGDKAGDSVDDHFSQNSIQLAVGKMSYHVYALGEGIVGKVAFTGQHMWISADKHVLDSCSSLKFFDGWLTQFLAGIRTIAVVSVVPYGVIQLGSFNNIAEDLKLVNHIRDIFFGLQDPLSGNISRMDCSSCLTNVFCKSSASRNYHDCLQTLGENMKKEKTNLSSSVFPSSEKRVHCSTTVPLPIVCPKKTVMIDKNGQAEHSVSGVCESSDFQSCSIGSLQQMNVKFANRKFEAASSNGKSNICDATLSAHKYAETLCSPSLFHDSAPIMDQTLVFCATEVSHMKNKKDPNVTLDFQEERNYMDTSTSYFQFSAGCELYEALGPAFKKQNTNHDSKPQQTATVQLPDEEICGSHLMKVNPQRDHLLEAVVANVCQSISDVKHEKPISGSAKSLLTAEEVLEPLTSDVRTICSGGYSFDRSSLVEDNILHCLPASEGFSSASHSKCSEPMDRPREHDKINRKRTRSGENCRPRPRDRQLIQDRIKELRELVPNGSKCSIDSLLERTIKHMLFMQCTTKHAEKLDKCAEPKLLDKETGVHGSSTSEHGSTWAMEVGSQSGVFQIVVENISMSGQMLVKMLCGDSSQFFEIAEAIRSLGLTILKGATVAYSGKDWIYFVVEDENNRNMHRMDLLWSLLQILQPKKEV